MSAMRLLTVGLRFIMGLMLFLGGVQPAAATDINAFYEAVEIEEKCAIADVLAQEYLSSNLDSLKLIGYDLLVVANEAKSELGINYARMLIGNYLIRSANELRGLELLRQAKNYFIGVEDYAKGTEICNEIGNAYQYLERINESVKWYKQSLKFGKLSSDEGLRYIAEINLAQAYMRHGLYDHAKRAAEHYRDWVLDMGSLKDVSNAYAVLGKMALEQEKNKEAIYYFEQCNKFAQKSGARAQQANAYTNIAIAVYLQGNPEKSVPLFEKALELRKLVNNIGHVCDAYLNLGGIYFELGDFVQAAENYELGINLARKHEKYLNEIELLDALMEVYTAEQRDANKVKNRLEKARLNLEQQKELQNTFDELLSGELKETERIQAGGFVTEKSKWPFYIGGFMLFAGFYFLAVRRKLI